MHKPALERKIDQIVRNILSAYSTLKGIVGRDIPSEALERVLEEIEHIAIHELAHGALRAVYPDIDRLEEENPTLGECIDEIMARILEVYVSSRIGAYTHSIEEHMHELKYYTTLSRLNIDKDTLQHLFSQATKHIKEGRIQEAINRVKQQCLNWINITA